MSIPQSSLDSILAAGRDAAPAHGVEEADVDQQALLNYLDQEYSDVLAAGASQQDASSAAIPASMYRLQSAAPGPSAVEGQAAAVAPAVPIPQSLLQLASTTPALPLDLSEADDIIDAAITYDEYGDRGEMGGKRRKQPHERAGWKEMDEGSRKRGKRGPRGPSAGTPGAASSPAPAAVTDAAAQQQHRWDQGQPASGPSAGPAHEPDANLESLQRDLDQVTDIGLDIHAGPDGKHSQAHHSGLVPDSQGHAFSQGSQPGQSASATGRSADDAANEKLDRAEQNRRAQQVYRRKREERMKQLEAAAAALEPTRKVLADTQGKLRTLAQSYEASRLEVVALRTALLHAAASGASVLGSDGALLVSRDGDEQESGQDTYDVQKALDQLEAQTRELARVRLESRS